MNREDHDYYRWQWHVVVGAVFSGHFVLPSMTRVRAIVERFLEVINMHFTSDSWIFYSASHQLVTAKAKPPSSYESKISTSTEGKEMFQTPYPKSNKESLHRNCNKAVHYIEQGTCPYIAKTSDKCMGDQTISLCKIIAAAASAVPLSTRISTKIYSAGQEGAVIRQKVQLLSMTMSELHWHCCQKVVRTTMTEGMPELRIKQTGKEYITSSSWSIVTWVQIYVHHCKVLQLWPHLDHHCKL